MSALPGACELPAPFGNLIIKNKKKVLSPFEEFQVWYPLVI